MRWARAGAVLAAAWLGAACAGLRAPPPYPGAPAVRAVELEGTSQLDADLIRSRLGTAPGGPWPWDAPRRFDPAIWAEDLARIPRIYQAEGFYGARVIAAEVRPVPGGVVARAVVEEGAPVRLVELDLRGLEGLPAGIEAEAREAVRLRVGARFREADWTATRTGLVDRLQAAGYLGARAEGEARVAPADGVARALLEVRPGPRVAAGAIRLTTPLPPGVPGRAVTEEVRAAAPAGAWLTREVLAEAQARVFRMGVFSAVEVQPGPRDEAAGTAPVEVAVRPGPRRSLAAGAGIGLGPFRDDLHLSAEWIERQLGGGLRTLRLSGQAGLAAVPTFATALSAAGRGPERYAPVASILADLDVARVLDRPGLHLVASGGLELAAAEAYRARAARAALGAAWEATPRLELQLHERLEVARLFDTPLSSDRGAGGAAGCPAPCTISSLELRASVDSHGFARRDAPGGGALVQLRAAGGPLGGGHRFVQARVELGGSRPLGARGGTVLAAGLRLASVWATGGGPVPVLARVSGGGAGMRGYGPGRLSPRLGADVGGRRVAVPVGGGGLLEATFEVRRRLAGSLQAVVFADAGAASVGAFAPGDLLARLTVAIGAGLRVGTPLGPVRLELAWRSPIGPALPEVTAPGSPGGLPAPSGCFGLGRGRMRGGGPDSPCAVHISIGEVP